MSEQINPHATIEELWRKMITVSHPTVAANPKGVQYREMQAAFYAGFMECLNISLAIAGLTEEEGCKALEALHAQMRVFALAQIAAVLKKKAGDN